MTDYVPLLVRVVGLAPPRRGWRGDDDAPDAARARGRPDDGLSKVGDDDPVNDAGDAERDRAGPALRLPAQEHQSCGQGATGQRVPPSHRGPHAREQM